MPSLFSRVGLTYRNGLSANLVRGGFCGWM